VTAAVSSSTDDPIVMFDEVRGKKKKKKKKERENRRDGRSALDISSRLEVFVLVRKKKAPRPQGESYENRRELIRLYTLGWATTAFCFVHDTRGSVELEDAFLFRTQTRPSSQRID